MEFGGDKELIDVMVPWTFAMDRMLDLVRAVSQDFLPGFALGDSPRLSSFKLCFGIYDS